jgi:hypothetical protein
MECFHDQGQEANFAHIPVTVQVVAGYTHRRRPAQLGPHDSAPSVRSPPPPLPLLFAFSFVFSQQRSSTIQRSSAWHIGIAGFSVSSWERGKQGVTK